LSELPKRILSLLMVGGAQSPEKAVTIEELGTKLSAPPEAVSTELNELIVGGYVQLIMGEGQARAYLTGTGIITASSTYS